MNQTSLKYKLYSLYDSELVRTFESKNHLKIKITCDTELWKMDAFGKEYHSWMLA